jgi:hypothetical protein
MIGFLWYGVLFSDQWISLQGLTIAEVEARNASLGAMMYVWGLIISLVQVIGIGAVLNWAGASVLITCAKIGAMIALLIVTPVLGYNVLYAGSPQDLLLIDASHLFVAYVLAAMVLGFFRKD